MIDSPNKLDLAMSMLPEIEADTSKVFTSSFCSSLCFDKRFKEVEKTIASFSPSDIAEILNFFVPTEARGFMLAEVLNLLKENMQSMWCPKKFLTMKATQVLVNSDDFMKAKDAAETKKLWAKPVVYVSKIKVSRVFQDTLADAKTESLVLSDVLSTTKLTTRAAVDALNIQQHCRSTSHLGLGTHFLLGKNLNLIQIFYPKSLSVLESRGYSAASFPKVIEKFLKT